MADSRRGPAPPPRPGQGPRDSGGRGARANRRLATVLGGGVLAAALAAVAYAGLTSNGASTTVSDASSPAAVSGAIGPSIPKARPVPGRSPVGVSGPSVGKPAVTAKATVPAKASAPAKVTVPAKVASAAPLPVATKVAVPVATTKPVATPAPAVKPVVKPVTPVTKPVAGSPSAGRGHVAASPITYRVARGDSLWTLTERSLASTGRSTSPGNVAAFLTRFYSSNGTTVGSDPDLIMPGQTITWPAGL